MSRKLFPARLATAALVAAAALTAAGATEAAAAPQFRTLTELNQFQSLGVQGGAGIVTAPPLTDANKFELVFPGSAGSSEPGFGSAFQLKNKASGKCLRDNGPDARVTEQTCFASPAAKSAQLWQHHTAVDFQQSGKDYRFVFNRKTGRVLSRAPQFGSPVDALSSPKASTTGSAASRLQLWNLQRV